MFDKATTIITMTWGLISGLLLGFFGTITLLVKTGRV